jgi:TPR repeat protein
MSEAAPYDTKRVIWLTKWLDAFYSHDELKDFTSFCKHALKETKPADWFLIAQALGESEKLEEGFKNQLVQETAEDLKDKISEADIWGKAHRIKTSKKENILLEEIDKFIKQEKFPLALDKLNEVEETNEIAAYYGKGYLYDVKKEYDKAEKYYLLAADKGHALAMLNLGVFYESVVKDNIKAEKYYLMSAEHGNPLAFILLAACQTLKEDEASTEKYLLKAAEKNFGFGMIILAFFYFFRNYQEKKYKALELSEKGMNLLPVNSHHLGKFLYIVSLLWNEKVKDATERMQEFLASSSVNNNETGLVSEAFKYFLVFKQKNTLNKIFSTNNEWKDQYKPIYYALMHEMQDEYPKEYLKMTEELQEPVDAILEFVKKEQKRLGID